MTDSYAAAYDAWNRLVEVKDGANVVLKCEYDGLGRRTKKFVNTSDPLDQTFDAYRHFFYSAAWQILETRRSGSENDPPESENPEVQYVWSRRYIDAPVLRDRDVEAGGDLGKSGSGLDQRLYYTTDANMNVTALLDTGGDAVERYVYDPYGTVTVYSDDWSTTVDWDDSKKNPVRYCGYFFDNETGLYCVRYRFYVPPLGRWLQRDPSGYADGMGLYEYVVSSPVAKQDPSGLFGGPAWSNYDRYSFSGKDRQGRSESIFEAIAREARSRGKNFCAGFDVTFMVIPVCPGVTIEGSAGLQGCVLECCHLDGPHVGKTGLMIDGTVWVKVSGGIGTSVGKQIYRGGASAHITKSMPPCENTLSLAIDVGVGGHASVGWGPASTGPEFDVHYTIGLYDDPGGFDWSGGIGTGRGTGVRLEVYGKGHGDGRMVVKEVL